jgi:predicted ATPase/DNA-binding SARP family transcriptional activator
VISLEEGSSVLKIKLLGTFEVEQDGTLLSSDVWPQRKTHLLLKLLLTARGQFFSQDQLIEALFPELGLEKGARSLRSRVSELRRVFEPKLKHGSGSRYIFHENAKGYAFTKEIACWVDADDFEEEINLAHQAEGRGRWREALQHYEHAIGLYRDDYLIDDLYEDWTIPPRERWRELYLKALARLAECYARFRQFPQAIAACQRVLEREAWHEGIYRQKILYHYHAGEYAEALHTYQACLEALESHLQVKPAVETQTLYKQLEQHEVPVLPTVYANNLPQSLSSFVGREREIAEIRELILSVGANGRSPLHRLVTLTGIGGSGKTRLALSVASELLREFADGVWWVDFSPQSDPTLLSQTIARALGLRETSGCSLIETLEEYLSAKQALIILDNCEHMIERCAEFITRVLRGSTTLQILATSRESLGISGEIRWPVTPMALPEQGPLPPLKVLQQYESISLFVERALESTRDFKLTPESAVHVVQICRQVEGLPLAIELAAARLRVLSLEEITEGLTKNFHLLSGHARGFAYRHQTIAAMMDWSYRLLSEPEQKLLRALSVFRGGFLLEAAKEICKNQTNQILSAKTSSSRSYAQETDEIFDLLTHLVEKSLVVVARRGKETRYRLLETVREYSQEKLIELAEQNALQQKHLDYFLALVLQAEPELQGEKQDSWFERFSQEHDNFRAALTWSLQSNEEKIREKGLQLMSIFWRFWYGVGYLSEGRQWLEQILEATPNALATVRAKTLNGLGSILHFLRESARARACYEESLLLQRQLGNQRSVAASLINLGALSCDQGDYAGAQNFLTEGLALSRALGDQFMIGYALNHLGRAAFDQGDFETARTHYAEGLPLLREAGNKPGVAWLLNNLGAIASSRGDHRAAHPYFEESLQMHREAGNKLGMALALDNLGMGALARGDLGAAQKFHHESLNLFRELGDKQGMVYGLEGFASFALAQTNVESAARLLGAASALRESIGFLISPREREHHEEKIRTVKHQLGERLFEQLWSEGRAISLEKLLPGCSSFNLNPSQRDVLL